MSASIADLRASLSASRAIKTASSVSREKNFASASAANNRSCCTAAGRYKSAAATITFLPRRCCKNRANLPTVVVLPAPCNPHTKITTGGCPARFNSSLASPIKRTNSSCTILITACPGDKLVSTSLPNARVLTCSINSRATAGKRYIRLQQCNANFAHRVGDVFFGQSSASAQVAEGLF